jgi:hypothetical protein
MWARLRDLVAVALLIVSGAAVFIGELALILTGQWQLAATIGGVIGVWCALQLGTHDPDPLPRGARATGGDDESGPTRADSRA